MMTVNEVSKLTGVSIRTLQYYDKIGLLHPTGYTESGYRLYDDAALETMQQILLFRELEFPLKDIRKIITAPDFDRNRALEQQIELLTMKKEHLENLILFARGIKGIGVKTMDFSAFDTRKIDEYAAEAKAKWGKTAAYQEFMKKRNGKEYTDEEDRKLQEEFMKCFVRFGSLREQDPASEEVQKQVQFMQNFMTEHFYTCTNEILSALGKMYSGGGDFTENIDQVGGEGTAVFVARAIEIYCK
ncbi:MAG: MerR family transcriptional regulator [Eubacteriales bacterium]|nr:MerR family transcriptional regulator [Eubacteriales bacterium]